MEKPARRSLWNGRTLSTVLIHPVQAGKDIFGYICIWELGGELRSLDAVAVEQAAVVMALQFNKQRAVREMERRFFNDFVWDILNGRIGSISDIQSRASVYGWNVQLPRVLIVVQVVNLVESDLSIDRNIRRQQRIDNAIMRDPMAHRVGKFFAHLGSFTVLFMEPTSTESTKREACEFAERLLAKLRIESGSEACTVNIGISRLSEDVSRFPAAFREAQEALQISVITGMGNKVIHYDDLGVYRILSRISDFDELERFRDEKLGPLLAYDRRNGTNLLNTLNAIIEASGNLRQASEDLFIHYNTLRYRLERIEQLSGIKVDSWRVMIEVALAIKAHQILQVRK